MKFVINNTRNERLGTKGNNGEVFILPLNIGQSINIIASFH